MIRDGERASATSSLAAFRRIATVIGGLLLVAALAVLWRQRDLLDDAMAALEHPAPAAVATLLAAVLANIVLTGLMFSVLMRPHGRIPLLEMQALIAGATLVNYLPLRPGLFGRVLYHQTVHGIPAFKTGGVIVAALVITGVLAAVLASVAGLSRVFEWPLWIGAVAPAPILVAAAAFPGIRRWCVAGLLRHADLLVWAVRYDVAFRLIDAPITPDTALALACVSVVATLVPLASNGLGLREWAIGIFAPFLSPHSLELGLTADLVNRAAEVMVVLVVGGPALIWVIRKARLGEATKRRSDGGGMSRIPSGR